jgi:HEAT repeat protein
MALNKINDYLQHTLREDFDSPNPEVRKAALFALGRLGSGPEVLDIIKHIAAEDEDPEVRYTAKKALNYWEGVLSEESSEPEDVDILDAEGKLDLEKLQKSLGSPRSGLQIATVVAAVRHGDEACLSPLLEALKQEQDPWVISMMAKAIGSLGGVPQVPDLLPLLEHSNHRVVANAIEAIEMLDDPERETHLGVFLDSPDNRVRANAVKALYPVAPQRAVATLRSMAINHRPWMRASAIFCLKILDDPACEPILLEMLLEEYAEDLLRQLLDALMVRGSEISVGTLGVLIEDRSEGREDELRTAQKVLAEKLGLNSEAIPGLVIEARKKFPGSQGGARSGIFLVEDIEEPLEEEMREARPAQEMEAIRLPRAEREKSRKAKESQELPRVPASGYGKTASEARPPGAEVESKAFLIVALVLAVLAALYGGFRLLS